MRIAGFQPNSLLDFPGNIAAMVFVGGCNMRCWYCHNAAILDTREFLDEQAILDRIKDNFLLDGVVISGGEPTLQPDLFDFAKKIKDMGLEVKLDTNGLRPAVIKEGVERGLFDYVAMDIKAPFDKACVVTPTVPWNADKLRESVAYLMSQDKIPYEFRMTVIPQFTVEDVERAAQEIAGARIFYLQCRPRNGAETPVRCVSRGSARGGGEVRQNRSALNVADAREAKIKSDGNSRPISFFQSYLPKAVQSTAGTHFFMGLTMKPKEKIT